MPVNFDALKHPRDSRGRFTKSRTVLASAKDKKAVKEITGGFQPAKTGDGKAYAGKIADPEQQGVARNFALDAKAINEDLRAGHADAAGVKPMDAAMRPLPDDLVLHRSVPSTAFGSVDPQSLQGMKVRDAGFSATQIDPLQPSDGVHMFIAAPKGSRAVPNADTGEVYLDRDSEMVVSRVEKNSAGGHDMYLTVLPKQGAAGKADASKPGPAKAAEPDKPQGEDEFRASLMKQTVGTLQAQMRERGLKPGKRRKSELVDALVADEMGHDAKQGDTKRKVGETAKPDSPTSRADAPAPASPASAEDKVRNAIEAIIDRDGGGAETLVSLAKVRDELGDLPRSEVDAALLRLDRERVLQLEPDPNRRTLTERSKAAAVRLGGEDMHLVGVIKRRRASRVRASATPDPHAALLQQQWEQAREDLLKQWPETAQSMVDELAGQAEAAAQAGDVSALGGLEASAGVISALATPLSESGSKLAKQAAAGVVAEAADAKVTITAPVDAGAERVRQTAEAVAQIIARGYASGAARVSLQLAGSDPAEVKTEVERQLGELGQSQGGLVGDNVGALLSAAQHAGRLAVLEQHPAKGYEAVETNDLHRCSPCAEESGSRFTTLRAALKDYPNAGYVRCAGGSRCRGHIRPIWT